MTERQRLPNTRRGITHRVVIHSETLGRFKLFLTVNFYPDGRPAELFLTADRAGTPEDGWADAWATAISLLLQVGYDWPKIAEKFAFQKFEPRGLTDNLDIPFAHSPVDYVVRYVTHQLAGPPAEEAPCIPD